MRVRALEKMYYNRSDRNPGDVYDMDDREEAEAKTLALLGKIEIIKHPEPDVSRGLTYETRHEIAAAAEPMTTTEDNTTPKRYHRRDMRPKK